MTAVERGAAMTNWADEIKNTSSILNALNPLPRLEIRA
jgi:hypothetical protein